LLREPLINSKISIFNATIGFLWSTAAEADNLYDYIYDKAQIGRRGGGIIMQGIAAAITPYTLPEGIPDEPDE